MNMSLQNNDHTYIKLVYNDDLKKQLVGSGTISPDIVNTLHKQFNIAKENYEKRELTWAEKFNSWIYGVPNNKLEFFQNFTSTRKNSLLEQSSWIRLSIDFIKSIGIKININNMNEVDYIDEVIIRYKEFTVGDGFEEDGYSYFYEYSDNVIQCIFCIQKDEGIKDGQIAFYPNFTDECKFGYGCFLPHKEMILPVEKGTVIILSGRTVNNIPKISGNGVMRFITVFFYKNE